MNIQEHKRMVMGELTTLRAAAAKKWVRDSTPALVAEFEIAGEIQWAPELCDAIRRELAAREELKLEEIPL